MNDFLVNLLRRGAGLPPVVVPRRPNLPAELSRLDDLKNEEGGLAAAPTKPPAAEPGARPGDRSTFVAPSRHAEAPSPGHRAAAAAEGEPPVERAVSLRAASSRAEPPTANPPSPPPGDARPGQQGVRGFPPPVSSSAAPPQELVTPGAEVRSTTHPAPQPALLALAAAAPREAPAQGTAASPLMRSAAHVVGAGPPAPLPTTSGPLPLPIAPSREAALQVLESARGPVEPRIEVRIGRIEIRPTPASPPPAPAPRRGPRGFQERASARRYLDRRWY